MQFECNKDWNAGVVNAYMASQRKAKTTQIVYIRKHMEERTMTRSPKLCCVLCVERYARTMGTYIYRDCPSKTRCNIPHSV